MEVRRVNARRGELWRAAYEKSKSNAVALVGGRDPIWQMPLVFLEWVLIEAEVALGARRTQQWLVEAAGRARTDSIGRLPHLA
jgi:hypothetical protein